MFGLTRVLLQTLETTGGEQSGWRVTELLYSLAASTPLLPLMTNQNCFLACQDPGMESMDYPYCWAFHQAAGSSQRVPCSCGCKGHTMALLPNFNSCKEQQDKDNYLPEELLTSGALRGYSPVFRYIVVPRSKTFPSWFKSASNAFKNNYWKEQNNISF